MIRENTAYRTYTTIAALAQHVYVTMVNEDDVEYNVIDNFIYGSPVFGSRHVMDKARFAKVYPIEVEFVE